MPKAKRMTKQKQTILEILRSTTCHPTADWIYEQARKKLPDISLGTVYRNLNVLRDEGEIMELNYGSTFSRFDGNPRNHYHFVCESCGQVYDVDYPVQNQLEKVIEEKTGARVQYHRLEFYGICSACLENKDGQPS
ncbi:Fur family transcriptional regulator [Calderihabitans maritimus]|uniref:Ferric uptake regulator, Fur family n=1 Tax=Calderihabitans maritimus TaxID=1246530 RepID=A0A1Z5HUK5_9FIRM|nr:transcriptional repressor [Calderihabitans maritimus]GAW93005.1 ferric uptake regulator, Fur family [Calderihabitans maritimus]